jgi:hypothetical protein
VTLPPAAGAAWGRPDADVVADLRSPWCAPHTRGTPCADLNHDGGSPSPPAAPMVRQARRRHACARCGLAWYLGDGVWVEAGAVGYAAPDCEHALRAPDGVHLDTHEPRAVTDALLAGWGIPHPERYAGGTIWLPRCEQCADPILRVEDFDGDQPRVLVDTRQVELPEWVARPCGHLLPRGAGRGVSVVVEPADGVDVRTHLPVLPLCGCCQQPVDPLQLVSFWDPQRRRLCPRLCQGCARRHEAAAGARL